MTTKWIVLRDGAIWTDMLENEAACLFHIQESAENDNIFTEDDYEYRKMTQEEIEVYTNTKETKCNQI